MTIKISGLPGHLTSEQFLAFLEPVANIYSVHIVFDRITHKSKRFGFVQVRSRADFGRIHQAFHGKAIFAKQIMHVTEHAALSSLISHV